MMNRIEPENCILSRWTPLMTVAALACAPGLWAQEFGAAARVTFSRDVAPIFQRACQRCHRPDQPAPMSLLDYDSARPWAKSIKREVSNRRMPPWHADPTIGEYDPDPSLSDEEIATIVRWVDQGAAIGDPSDMPAPLEFPDAAVWEFGEPDLVVTMPEDYVVPAEGPDQFVNFRFPSGLKEDRYIKWIEVKPSKAGRVALHHTIAYAVQDDADYIGEDHFERDDDPNSVGPDGKKLGSLLIEYATGNSGDLFGENTGKLLKAGAEIRFGSHYHSTGKELRDRTSIGFGFYPKGEVPKYRVISTRIFAGLAGADKNFLGELDIPPNTKDVQHDGYRRFDRPAMLISFQAHMHYRGQAMDLEAIHLDGRQELLTRIKNYDFNWQVAYPYKIPPVFPAGTMMHVTSWHDNTADNPYNPDPDSWVHWGSTTDDEMAIGWTNFVYLTDEDYNSIIADRGTDQRSGGPTQINQIGTRRRSSTRAR